MLITLLLRRIKKKQYFYLLFIIILSLFFLICFGIPLFTFKSNVKIGLGLVPFLDIDDGYTNHIITIPESNIYKNPNI